MTDDKDRMLNAFRELSKDKARKAIIIVRKMEYGWGELANEDERKFYYELMELVGDEFATTFKDWLDAKWARCNQPRTTPRVIMPGYNPTAYEDEMEAAECAFRDFHYIFEDAYEKAFKEKPPTN